MSSTGVPYAPLVKMAGGTGAPGRMQGAVDEGGIPIWQGGDRDPQPFPVTSVGSFQGHVSTTRTFPDVRGTAYVTGARVMVVVSDFAKGTQWRTVGVPSLSNLAYNAVANRTSKSRARKAAAGHYLVGQMRLPWLARVAWAPSSMGRRQAGQIRLIGSHRSEFGDEEAVGLTFRLADASEAVRLVTLVVERVKADRLSFERTTAEQRSKLEALPRPAAVDAPSRDTLASLQLSGGWIITSGSAFLGSVSAASAEVPA